MPRVTVDDVLGVSSPLARMLAAYEDRPGQLAMAYAVERALASERPLFVEAGTGTGKTLAYLVPAILSGKRVVVSTATHALQEQIFTKDLPLVAAALAPFGITFRAALMKGLSNYLCRRRLADALAADEAMLARELEAVLDWSKDTETGDRSELVTLREGSPAWSAVQSGTDTRIGASCSHHDTCFVTRMKRDAEDAQIVVVNHHLYCADLALKRTRAGEMASVLPAHEAVVFDEAHQLEDVATSFFGIRLSTGKIEALARDVRRAIAGGSVQNPDAERALFAVERGAAAAFEALAVRAVRRSEPPPSARNGAASESKRAVTRADLEGPFAEAAAKLEDALTVLAHKLEISNAREGNAMLARRARDVLDVLRAIQRGVGVRRAADVPFDDDGVVYDDDESTRREHAGFRDDQLGHAIAWVDVRDRSVSLGASPIDLGRTFREVLFERVPTVVCTSATLAVGTHETPPSSDRRDIAATGTSSLDVDAEGAPVSRSRSSFHFFKSRLGAPSFSEELVVPSPFDFASRVGLYLPRDLPEPSAPVFESRAAERVRELVTITKGGAFVLCTSNRAMRAIHQSLRSARIDRPLYVQGDAPKHLLLARFRAAGDAVLVATMSFWEGVDVPGAALRLVIIDKIPFAVPSDPIVAARCAVLESEGGNPFMEYSVPMAAITLKQGFGRLVRTARDAGIVAILDRRVVTRGYGRTLLSGLPPARRLASLEEVATFHEAFHRPEV